MPYIDAHIHLFPPRLLRAIYRWFLDRGWALQYGDADASTLLDFLWRQNVQNAVVSCYAHKPGIAASLNTWLSEVAAVQPALVPLGTVHPDDPDLPAECRRCLETLGFRGFKIHCGVQRVAPDDTRLKPVYETALEFERPVLIHAGTAPYPAPWLGYERFRAVMRRYPRLKVQVAHLGMWEVREFLSLADRYESVYFDLAAVTDRHLALPPAALKEVLVQYPERVLYGTDFPIMEDPYPAFGRLLANLGLPEQVHRRVVRENAAAFWTTGLQPHGTGVPQASATCE